jgi:phosphatidate cytidylyltransferase
VLRHRVASAIVFAPLILAGVYLGGSWLFALIALLALIGTYEYWRMTARKGYQPTLVGMASLTLLLLVNASYVRSQETGMAIAALGVIATMLWFLFQDQPQALINWTLTLSGVGYIGLLLSHAILLRNLPDTGFQWTLLAVLAAWACDTAAYFTGRKLGRTPFFPRISPKKTWEGTIGGWAGAVIVIGAVGRWLGLPIGHCLALGAVLAVAATAGDLAESMIKRQLDTKDSGTLIPGHGGILDRVDSLLFVFPVAYYYVSLVIQS